MQCFLVLVNGGGGGWFDRTHQTPLVARLIRNCYNNAGPAGQAESIDPVNAALIVPVNAAGGPCTITDHMGVGTGPADPAAAGQII